MFRIMIGPDTNRGVGAAFTDRHGGVSNAEFGPLNLGRTDDDDLASVETNFERVRRAIGVTKVITAHQVHGADVFEVDQGVVDRWGPRSHLGTAAGQQPLPMADALVTTVPDIALCIRVADCVPVLLTDPSAGVIGAAHAGREGIRKQVLTQTVAAMRDLGADGEIIAFIGPHICGGCYEVGQQMADEVGLSHPWAVASTSWGTPSLDLGLAAEYELDALGVASARLDPCTRTSPELHSHRRDAERAGRLAGLIWRVSDTA